MILTATMNLLIDKLYVMEKNELGTVMRVQQVGNTAGGKGLNVSRISAQLGEAVAPFFATHADISISTGTTPAIAKNHRVSATLSVNGSAEPTIISDV